MLFHIMEEIMQVVPFLSKMYKIIKKSHIKNGGFFMKKKLLFIMTLMFLMIGCENVLNTPHNKVENFLGKYQRMDKSVLNELDTIIQKDKEMSQEQKKEYKNLLEKQYQNLSYKIKSEEINKNIATVEVEIEVLDYKTTIKTLQEKYINNSENLSYLDYQIQEMKKVVHKIKYPLTFYLKKENNQWKLENLTKEDRKKIHGLY